ncbi:pyridoxal phosphate-dependent transferase [Parasitella parasitica]|nr:pyridoxal phosphate-dependent transferase [Parasitella parasitica]
MSIDFMNGKPSADILPTKLFAQAAQKAFNAPDAANNVLQYGDELGHPAFLRNLAEFLSTEYGSHSGVFSRHLCATPGASLSLQHMLSMLTRPQTATRHVYFQDPTYFLAFDIFLDVGYARDQFVGIAEEDDSGINITILEDHLVKHHVSEETSTISQEKSGTMVFNSVLYCVPTHANPTGSILSDKKREKLVQLARKYNMLIICDDVYDILTFEGEIPKRLVAYDLESADENAKHVVISNGSFSKILAPGSRVGWIEAGETIIKQVGACGSFMSGGSPSHLSSQIINEMLLDNSLHQHVEFLRNTHANRLYQGLYEPIQRELVPLGCSIDIRPKGGYFVWLRVPIPGSQLMSITRQHNIDVGVGLGTLFTVTKSSEDDFYVRLSFAHYDTKMLQLGIIRLKQALLIGQSTLF